MKKVCVYTGDKTFMFPNGTIATPEVVKAKYPAVMQFKHAIETDDSCEVIYSIVNFSALRARYSIDASLNDEQACAAIEDIINTPPTPVEAGPSATERIAAALEYQNLLTMEDAEV